MRADETDLRPTLFKISPNRKKRVNIKGSKNLVAIFATFLKLILLLCKK
jgi:hypothetical protein